MNSGCVDLLYFGAGVLSGSLSGSYIKDYLQYNGFAFRSNNIIAQQYNQSLLTSWRKNCRAVEMAYTDDAVKAKLSALNETQESIVTVAQWLMFHR